MRQKSNRNGLLILVVTTFVLLGTGFAEELAFKAKVVGSNPNNVIGGVNSGGAPWVVKNGEAMLHADGKVRVDVRGLILPAVGTAGPITHVVASLVCGGSGGAVVASTDVSPLTPLGDATMTGTLVLPAGCFVPVILVRVAGVNDNILATPSGWIAVTGL